MEKPTQKEIDAIDNIEGRKTNNFLYNEFEIPKLDNLISNKKAHLYYTKREYEGKTLIYKIEKTKNPKQKTVTISRTVYNLPKTKKVKKAIEKANTEIDIDNLSKAQKQKLLSQILGL